MKGFGPTLSSFATESHELHRIRRGALAPFFSRASVYNLEPAVQSVVNKLALRLEAIQGSDNIINLIDVFTALTYDIICQYAFASPYGFIDTPDFAPQWHRAMMDASETSHLFKQFGWLEPTMRRLPHWLVIKMNPRLGALFTLGDVGLKQRVPPLPRLTTMQSVRDQVVKVKAELAEGKKPAGQKTIFYEMLTNDQLRPEDKTNDRLEQEGLSVVAAG